MRVTDRAWLRERLLREPAVHLYELGDLDDFFWPHATYYARGDAIALLYDPGDLPVLLALGDIVAHAKLLAHLRDELPLRMYAHLSPGLVDALAPRFRSALHRQCRKMTLVDRNIIAAVDTSDVVMLRPSECDEVVAFYAHAYPGNWFDPRMLETEQYFAVRERGEIVAAAGIHVYSATERVAALGNVAVAERARGRGLARRVTARVCASLLETVDHVGLNVRADNHVAIACYARLGFSVVAPYEEHMLEVTDA
jgi:predicted GNAT family acetyltransferase